LSENILNVDGLKTYFFTEAGIVKAVDGISFTIKKGESLGLVGESGSGKTVTALSILGLVPQPGKIVEGSIYFDGENLLTKSEDEMRTIRGEKISIIFQDPTSSLNPLFTIETQLKDIIRAHQDIDKDKINEQIINLLEIVGLPDPETRMREYPYMFSGGMKQRVAIARALALGPSLLFADEPTTNLDVTIQAQVLDLLIEIKNKIGMSLVMITHDMGIIAKMTSRVIVLYAGQICEIAPTRVLFEDSYHPYTTALLEAVPRLDIRKELKLIPGNIPNLITPPTGCRFHPRCEYKTDKCAYDIPVLVKVDNEHYVACHVRARISAEMEKG
jgi:oligopeptide/dipeptide ABC transporter ATP-binding protein